VKEFLKLPLFIFLFVVFAPLLGILIRKSLFWQRLIFFALCFSTIQGFLKYAEVGFTILPYEYRGHARGFHVFFAEVFAWTLVVARCFGDWKNFKLFPPGLGLYLLYCTLSFLSIFSAVNQQHVWTAAFKFYGAAVILVAAYNYVRNEKELKFFIGCMSVTMLWEAFVVLKMKYVDHIYQVMGTFEHQNSLSMFTSMIGMVLLAFSLGPRTNTSAFAFLAFIGCAAISQSTLSRAGLAVFAFGTVMVLLLSLWDKPTKRRWALTGALATVGAIGLAFTLDTIVARFNDYGNQESAMTRKNLNKAAWMMVQDYPTGVGWNNFARVINHPYPYGDHIDRWHMMHGNPVDRNYPKGVVESWYYLTLSETGWQGLFGLLVMIGTFLWWNVRAIWAFRGTLLGAVSIGIFVGCGINYGQSLLERVLTQPRNLFLWMLLLGITGKIEWMRRQKVKEDREAARGRNVRRPKFERVQVSIDPPEPKPVRAKRAPRSTTA